MASDTESVEIDCPITAEDVISRTHPNRDPANEPIYFSRHDEVIIDGETREITGYCYNNCDLVAQAPTGYEAAAQFALGSHGTRLALHFGAGLGVPSVGVYHHDGGWMHRGLMANGSIVRNA